MRHCPMRKLNSCVMKRVRWQFSSIREAVVFRVRKVCLCDDARFVIVFNPSIKVKRERERERERESQRVGGREREKVEPDDV